jgi:transposase
VNVNRFLEICAGIDVGKREIAVTVLTGAPDAEPVPDTRTFGTTTRQLQECTSTPAPSKSRCVLHAGLAVNVVNPEHVQARRGEKTDAEDSRRLAEQLRVGDMRGSFIPPENVMALRDLTRRRKRLLNAANSERNRVQKLLERGSVRFGNVVSDVFGVSGQRFLQALPGDQPATAEQIA